MISSCPIFSPSPLSARLDVKNFQLKRKARYTQSFSAGGATAFIAYSLVAVVGFETTFYTSVDGLGGMATGGIISLFALIALLLLHIVATVGHAMRVLGKTSPKIVHLLANWVFPLDIALGLLSILAFPIAFASSSIPSPASVSTSPAAGLGFAVLVMVIGIVLSLIRIPAVSAKIAGQASFLGSSTSG